MYIYLREFGYYVWPFLHQNADRGFYIYVNVVRHLVEVLHTIITKLYARKQKQAAKVSLKIYPIKIVGEQKEHSDQEKIFFVAFTLSVPYPGVGLGTLVRCKGSFFLCK